MMDKNFLFVCLFSFCLTRIEKKKQRKLQLRFFADASRYITTLPLIGRASNYKQQKKDHNAPCCSSC